MGTELGRYEKPLSVREKKRLAELEQVIQDNFLGFVAVGQALAEINEQRLYRTESGRTFEDYCKQLWDMNVRHAYRLIESAKVVEQIAEYQNVTHGTQNDTQVAEIILPQNERQARELARLDPEDQRTVWFGLVEAAREQGGSGRPARITAGAVKKAVKAFKGEQFGTVVKRIQTAMRENRTDFASEEFNLTFSAFLAQVDIERNAGWRHTSRKTCHKHIMTLADLVAEAGPAALETGCALELSDREKLREGGFRIFRMNPRSMLIEEWRRADQWAVHTEHESPAEMSEAFKELMLDHRNLRG